MKTRTKPVLTCLILLGSLGTASAQPPFSLSLDALGALPSLNLPSGANHGLGLSGGAYYRLTDSFDLGLTGGLVEFIAPDDHQDMKTVWLDLTGRYFPFPNASGLEPYVQIGFGFSPYVGGIFEDYWSYYAAQYFGQATAPGTLYLTTEAAIGSLFPLGGDWAWDAGLQYDAFWPPTVTVLQTLGLRTGVVWSFGL